MTVLLNQALTFPLLIASQASFTVFPLPLPTYFSTDGSILFSVNNAVKPKRCLFADSAIITSYVFKIFVVPATFGSVLFALPSCTLVISLTNCDEKLDERTPYARILLC
ncbi:hypothetical protein F5878DRAFT_610763 [Lentinula raphanica]|uniref:Uncharacterized protein n=1 Tax=Lentinula raphanica TaxID=153919 RepID=A0AA38UH48_9AGAR|nr:hypothetical protein F5878DRAFT_610763 [Lentinula raphanica]